MVWAKVILWPPFLSLQYHIQNLNRRKKCVKIRGKEKAYKVSQRTFPGSGLPTFPKLIDKNTR